MATHRIAGIDVHKKMLAVVVLDAAEEGEWRLHRRKFLTTANDLDALADWLASLEVREAVMESTAQYWRPVWRVLEPQCHVELAQAQSNRGPRGRKNDFADAERLGGNFSSAGSRRTSRAYNSVVIQFDARVVSAQQTLSSLRRSSQEISPGEATGMLMARSR